MEELNDLGIYMKFKITEIKCRHEKDANVLNIETIELNQTQGRVSGDLAWLF